METSIIIPGLKESILMACDDFNWKPTVTLLLQTLKEDSLEYQQLVNIRENPSHIWYGFNSRNIIIECCKRGYIELISVFINNNFPVNYNIKVLISNQVGEIIIFHTMLTYATTRRQIPLMKYLISQGAEVNYASDSGFTPIICAIDTVWVTHTPQNSQIDVVKFLLEAGCNVNGNSENVPLCRAVENNNIDCVKLLIEYGADVNKKGHYNSTALLHAVVKERPVLQIIELLLNAGAHVNIKHPVHHTVLHLALKRKNLKIIELLVERGADINDKTLENNTALYDFVFVRYPIMHYPEHGFVSENDINIVGTLVIWGLDINISDDFGRTLLHWAAWQGSVNLVKLLIEKGLDENDKLGKKPIHYASDAGHHNVVQFFIDYYCDKFT